MNRKTQLILLIVVLAVVGAAAAVAIPQMAQAPQEVQVVNDQGQTVLQSDYLARYREIPHSRTEDGAFVLGEADAPVTVVEFADFLCPHCQNYHATSKQFIEQYVATGQAKFEYRLFPVVDPELSPFSAQLAECVGEQDGGKFWAAHDMLYDLGSRGRIDLETTPQALAETLELDANLLLQCQQTATQHETDTAVGTAAGVNGTPTMFIRVDEDTLGYPYLDGRIYNQGGLPLNIIQQVIEAESLEDVVVVPQPLLANLVDADETCPAPCWRGITPGETSWEDAAEIVRASGDLREIQEQSAADDSGAKVMSWQSLDGINCCNMLSETGKTVDELLMLTPSTFTIGELVEARGEPTHAITRETGQGGYIVSVFYPEDALIVYVFVEGNSPRDFTEESGVVGASYMSAARSESVFADLLPSTWAGYGALLRYESLATAEPEVVETDEAVPTEDVVGTEEAGATEEAE
jgi:protein-disulfide isomerase